MSLCKIMVLAYQDNLIYEGFDEQDLRFGIFYAKGMIGLGYIKEPFYKFNLNEFIEWATNLRGNR